MIIRPNRYSTAGLAHSAADAATQRTGIEHRMVFAPTSGGYLDRTPFTIKAFEPETAADRKAAA
jgi:hypothetical protein